MNILGRITHLCSHPRTQRLARILEPLREKRCAACGVPVPLAHHNGAATPLCATCQKALARRESGFCIRCGEITTPSLPCAVCGECLSSPRPWERFFFHGAYQGLLRELVLRFKSRHEIALAALLGSFLANHPGITGPYDAVIPLPLHPQRLRERGFNQSLELSRLLAGRLGAPLQPGLLTRAKATLSQAGLPIRARRDNMRGAFAVSPEATQMRVLLVDDVATTCATLESATHALLTAGTFAVDVAVLARTPEDAHSKSP